MGKIGQPAYDKKHKRHSINCLCASCQSKRGECPRKNYPVNEK